jgi:organic radical activating enzyme
MGLFDKLFGSDKPKVKDSKPKGKDSIEKCRNSWEVYKSKLENAYNSIKLLNEIPKELETNLIQCIEQLPNTNESLLLLKEIHSYHAPCVLNYQMAAYKKIVEFWSPDKVSEDEKIHEAEKFKKCDIQTLLQKIKLGEISSETIYYMCNYGSYPWNKDFLESLKKHAVNEIATNSNINILIEKPLISLVNSSKVVLEGHYHIDQENRGRAAEILGVIKSHDAVPSLIHQLNTCEHLALEESCINALGEIGDVQAVDTLISLLTMVRMWPDFGGKSWDSAYPLKKPAIRALRMIGDVRAIQPLEKFVVNNQGTNLGNDALDTIEEIKKKNNLK